MPHTGVKVASTCCWGEYYSMCGIWEPGKYKSNLFFSSSELYFYITCSIYFFKLPDAASDEIPLHLKQQVCLFSWEKWNEHTVFPVSLGFEDTSAYVLISSIILDFTAFMPGTHCCQPQPAWCFRLPGHRDFQSPCVQTELISIYILTHTCVHTWHIGSCTHV